MARIARFRSSLLLVCAVLVASLLADVGTIAPAFSLGLPLETPTVPVQTPPVPVKTPTLPPVKAPTVPVKTPTVPVTVPVKIPTVPVKAPTVPVKTPTPPAKTLSSKTPAVPVKAPVLPSKTPAVSVTTPSVNVRTPAGSASVPSATVRAPSTPTSGPAPRPAGGPHAGTTPTVSASSPGASLPGAGGSGASAPPLGAYGSPGVGYAELPASEGSPNGRARARIARRERGLKATVARLGECLSALPAQQRELLELRTGYANALPLSPRAAAARLNVDAAHIAGRERRAIRELRAAASTHSCSRTSEVVDGVVSFIAASFGDGQARATGGVEAVRYESAPIVKSGRTSPSTVGRILGADISPTASDVILVLALLMALGTIVALVLADAAGQGPRHEQWRQRVANRLRSLR